jgi:hypothetical protein
MATTFVSAPARALASSRVAPARAQIGGGTVTYFYRTSGGTRASTTDLGAIPAGAVIERTVTT